MGDGDGILLQHGTKPWGQSVVPAPPGIGVHILALRDRRGHFPRFASTQGSGQMLLQARDFGPGLGPAVEFIASEQASTEQGSKHFEKEGRSVDRNGTGMFVAPVKIHAAGKGEGARAVASFGEDLQIDGIGGVPTYVDQSVVARLERVNMVGTVTGHIGPVLRTSRFSVRTPVVALSWEIVRSTPKIHPVMRNLS